MQIKTTNPYTKVVEELVQSCMVEDGLKQKNIFVKDDEDRFQLATSKPVSTDYKLLSNDRADLIADTIMDRTGYQWKPLKHIWDGKKYMRFMYTEHEPMSLRTEGELTINRENKEDLLYLGMLTKNSYDGSCAFQGMVFAFRMLCSNQFIDRNLFGRFHIRHTEDIESSEFQQELECITNSWSHLAQLVNSVIDLKKRSLDHEEIKLARKNTTMPSSSWGAVLDRMNETEADTLFGLHDAMTYVSSRMKSFNQVEVGQSISDYFFN